MKKEQVLTQALLGGETQQSQNQEGGGVMRKYVWSTIDASGRLVPYVALECSEEIAKEIESRDGYEKRWMFIAEKLHEKYPEQFPEWWAGHGKRHVFWYNNVLEDWEEAHERLVEEKMRALREYYDDEEALLEEAKIRAEEELNNLPVFRIYQQTKTLEGGEAMKELTQQTQSVYHPDDRELWWCSRLGDVSLYVYDYEEAKEQGVDCLVELTPFVRIHERCDCMERFNTIQHNNGGWYHRIIKVFQIAPEVYIATYEDTRDPFYASELRYAVVYIGGDAIGKITLKEGEWAELLKREEAEKLIKSYEGDQDYRVYYED